MIGQEPAIVGVSPPVELKRRRRLFECLGRAASVRFEGREASAWGGCDAAVLFGSLTPRAEALPPQALVVSNGPPSSPSPAAPVELSPSDTVDVALRGRRLPDDRVGSLPPLDMEGEKVLASAFGVPI
jgi:hypothetical protein